MGQEIERKFRVTGDGWRSGAVAVRLRQGYLVVDDAKEIRVRIKQDSAWIAIKSRGTGPVRAEFEYPIPIADAEAMLDRFCADRRIDKTRHTVAAAGREWLVDVFEGRLAGLVLAEVELDTADATLARPDWVGEEVTEDARFFNAALAQAAGPPED